MATRQTDLNPGDEVAIPWGLSSVRATVEEVYGSRTDPWVLVLLTPELSHVVAEPTTISLPKRYIDALERAG